MTLAFFCRQCKGSFFCGSLWCKIFLADIIGKIPVSASYGRIVSASLKQAPYHLSGFFSKAWVRSFQWFFSFGKRLFLLQKQVTSRRYTWFYGRMVSEPVCRIKLYIARCVEASFASCAPAKTSRWSNHLPFLELIVPIEGECNGRLLQNRLFYLPKNIFKCEKDKIFIKCKV